MNSKDRNVLVRLLRRTVRQFLVISKLQRFRRVWRRYRFGKSYISKNSKLLRSWVWKNTEESNFYYELEELNELHLKTLLSYIFKVEPEVIQEFFNELKFDEELRSFISTRIREEFGPNEIIVNYGRRLCWYAIARLKKPKLIVETGIQHGVGALVLCKALEINMSEGYPGRYVGTELNTKFGFLLNDKGFDFAEIIYGDSISTLEAFNNQIDLFISDSDHDKDYEYREYLTVNKLLSNDAFVIGDNAHVSDSLVKYSVENERNFIYFDEWSKDHWYPGAGVGLSFK